MFKKQDLTNIKRKYKKLKKFKVRFKITPNL